LTPRETCVMIIVQLGDTNPDKEVSP
jgi:hypothetical protein